jgi:hypothetical protein
MKIIKVWRLERSFNKNQGNDKAQGEKAKTSAKCETKIYQLLTSTN